MKASRRKASPAEDQSPVVADPSAPEEDTKNSLCIDEPLVLESGSGIEQASMPVGFERIVTYQFRPIDDKKEYDYLRSRINTEKRASALQLGELIDELDRAQEDAHRAAELAARGRVAYERFKFDCNSIESTLRLATIAQLEKEKSALDNAGKKGKQITNADVAAYVMSYFPDESAALLNRKTTAKEHVSLLEDLAIRLAERAKDLRAMVARSRAVD